MIIQEIIIMKKFLGYFLISFPESSIVDFTIIEPILNLRFGFSNIKSHTAHSTFKKI